MRCTSAKYQRYDSRRNGCSQLVNRRGKSHLKYAALPALQHGLGCLLRSQQCGHAKVFLCCQRRIDKPRIDHATFTP